MGNAFDDILQGFSSMDEYAKYLMDIEHQFYTADNDTEALRLAFEAKQKGYSNCLFDYVIAFCYNNGKGGLSLNKSKAGEFFKASADSRDTNGNYYNEKHADESRATLAEDFALKDNQFDVIDVSTAIDYCKALIAHDRFIDDSLLYLSMIYGRPQFGSYNVDKALECCEKLLHSTDPGTRNRAISIKQALLSTTPKPRKSIFSIFNKS